MKSVTSKLWAKMSFLHKIQSTGFPPSTPASCHRPLAISASRCHVSTGRGSKSRRCNFALGTNHLACVCSGHHGILWGFFGVEIITFWNRNRFVCVCVCVVRHCWGSGPGKKIPGNSAFDSRWASRWDDHLWPSSEASGRPCGTTRQHQSAADKEWLKERLFYSSLQPFCSWKPWTASVGGGFVECRSNWFWKTVSAAEWKQRIWDLFRGNLRTVQKHVPKK